MKNRLQGCGIRWTRFDATLSHQPLICEYVQEFQRKGNEWVSYIPESIEQIVRGFIERAGTCREGADNYPKVDYFVTSDHVEVAICPFISTYRSLFQTGPQISTFGGIGGGHTKGAVVLYIYITLACDEDASYDKNGRMSSKFN